MSSKFFKGPAYNVFSEDFALEVFKEVVVDNTTGSTGTAAGGGGATSVTVETDAFKSVSDGNTVQLSSSAAAPTLTVTPVGAISVDYTASSNTIQIGATEYVASGSDARIAYYDGAGNILSDTTGLFYEDVNRYLGVGVSSPTAFIHVSSSSDNAPLFRLSTPSAANMLIVTGSGLVGINTVPDAGKWLQVKDPDQNPRFYVSGDVYVAGSTDLKFDTDNRQIKNEGGSMRLNSHASHFIYLQDTASNVAIGMASSEDPTAKLHISGSDGDSLLKISSGPAGAEDLLDVSNVAVSASVGISASAIVVDSDSGHDFQPSIRFSAGQTGFYAATADAIGVTLGGSRKYMIHGTRIESLDQNGGIYLKYATGAEDSPTYAFNGNTGTGMWATPATSDLHFSTNEVNRVTISSSGDVGIGTTAPTAKLHLSGSTDNAKLLHLSTPSVANALVVTGSGQVLISKELYFGDIGGEYITQNGDGNLQLYAAGGSIDITAPTIDLGNGGSPDTTLNFQGTNTGVIVWDQSEDRFLIKDDVTFEESVKFNTNVSISGSTDNAKLLHLSTPSVANALVVTGSGNVGINTDPITDSGVSLAVGGAKVYLPDEWVWGSDTDTMLRKRTSNNVEFRMAGSDILGISGNGVFVEAGNLGVGTLTAVHRVHVQDGDIGIVTNSADAASQKLIFTKSRHATDGSHTVIQDDDILGAIEFQGSDGDSFAPAASIVARVQGTPGDGDCPTELVFGTTANGAEAVSEHLHIMENGFIGINDAAPATRFAIEAGASNEELFGRHASSGIIAIRDEIYSTNGATRWFRGGSNQHVIGAGDDFGGVIFNETGASANDFRVESANYTHAIFVDSSLDRIGIRTDTPEASMHVNGNFHATIIVETSQRDLKKNIKPQTSQLNNIMMLNPVDFTWKEDNKVSKGFIADEVVEVYPELVQKNDAGKPIGIEYAKMVSVLTQGMKELNEIVNKQQETIEKLLKKIEDKD